MKRRIALIFLLALWPLSGASGIVLVGLETGGYSMSRTAEGVYRTSAGNQDVDMKYAEDISYFGFGPIFDFGFAPGKASLRLAPILADGSAQVASGTLKDAAYDMLGFTQAQVETMSGKKGTIDIAQSAVGTEVVFKYNVPVDIPTSNETLKVLRKAVAITNPWFGLGPMAITYNRLTVFEGSGIKEYTEQNFTDFHLVIAGGMNFNLNEIYSKVPRNIYITFSIGVITNLTPDNGELVQDDTLNISESGTIFKFGAGYDI